MQKTAGSVENDPKPTFRLAASRTRVIDVALRVILDPAVERIGGPNLPRMRQNYQAIPLRDVEIDRPNSGETVEDKRQAPPRKKVGLVGNTEMKVRAHRGAGVPDLGKWRAGLNDIANLHVSNQGTRTTANGLSLA